MQTVGTVPKSERKIVENSIPITHKCMTAHFTALVKALQYKVTVLNSSMGDTYHNFGKITCEREILL